MFDPTIYENLKVVIEGEIYDLDLGNEILITDRQDYVNLATMSRSYSISFRIPGSSLYYATITLEADPIDLYGEILEIENKHGCKLFLSINGPIKDITNTPSFIQEKLEKIWEKRPTITQQISFEWSNDLAPNYHTKITLQFDRKINEDHISDFPKIISLLKKSLQIMAELHD